MRNFIFDFLADLHLRLRYCAGYYEYVPGHPECSEAMVQASMSIDSFWEKVTEDGVSYWVFREPEWISQKSDGFIP